MKKTFFVSLLFFIAFAASAQIEYGYERSSKDPWRFGLNAVGSWDWVNQQGIEKTFGWKAGFQAEKHLIHNIYFKPVLDVWKKGYNFESTGHQATRTEVDVWYVDFEATIELKFGNEYTGSGLVLSVAPFFSYGVGGTMKLINKDATLDQSQYDYDVSYNAERSIKAFENDDDDNNGHMKREDIGYVLGVAYDFNKHWQVRADYIIGYLGIGRYNNYRWRSLQAGLTYFF